MRWTAVILLCLVGAAFLIGYANSYTHTDIQQRSCFDKHNNKINGVTCDVHVIKEEYEIVSTVGMILGLIGVIGGFPAVFYDVKKGY